MLERASAPSRPRFAERPNLQLWIGGALILSSWQWRSSAPRLRPTIPHEQDLFAMMEPPRWAHPFGADQVGRDILSRIIAGTRYTLVYCSDVGRSLPALVGVALGGIAGLFRRQRRSGRHWARRPLVDGAWPRSRRRDRVRGRGKRHGPHRRHHRRASFRLSRGSCAGGCWSCGRRISSGLRSPSA